MYSFSPTEIHNDSERTDEAPLPHSSHLELVGSSTICYRSMESTDSKESDYHKAGYSHHFWIYILVQLDSSPTFSVLIPNPLWLCYLRRPASGSILAESTSS
jgi:hypothetical protein